ncbi:DUF2963 domain-containing protein [Candidatus Phytoplasma australiense]|uniref:DUF2963 domain-containing protein n=1 Tax=Strawberry lethal yellows phytoplasma (CPA) str. NZSb11 TaxID=980422 RepID=R4S042_PHYAS|nr:DUF2963 domain-containing protein [Candidatus Phytoplasma australiense]AGL90169.1 hypothetical protein SLY_0247 [Strawberry lethal yellows phytoplasma (CPA) str. NZSb11]
MTKNNPSKLSRVLVVRALLMAASFIFILFLVSFSSKQATKPKYPSTTEYTPDGKRIKFTQYQKDGKTIDSITEYNPQTGYETKQTDYKSDGKTIFFITEYNPQTGNETKKTYYNLDGTIKEEINY